MLKNAKTETVEKLCDFDCPCDFCKLRSELRKKVQTLISNDMTSSLWGTFYELEALMKDAHSSHEEPRFTFSAKFFIPLYESLMMIFSEEKRKGGIPYEKPQQWFMSFFANIKNKRLRKILGVLPPGIFVMAGFTLIGTTCFPWGLPESFFFPSLILGLLVFPVLSGVWFATYDLSSFLQKKRDVYDIAYEKAVLIKAEIEKLLKNSSKNS